METPDGNGQEQGSDMVTDHTSSDTKKATAGVKTSNSTSQNPESPREGHENRKPKTMIWESHYGFGRYGLVDPRMTAGRAKQRGKPTLAKTDVVQSEAPDSNITPIQSCISVPEGNKAANESGDIPLEPQ